MINEIVIVWATSSTYSRHELQARASWRFMGLFTKG